MKKIFSLMMIFGFVLLSSFALTSCCSPRGFVAAINFLNADSRLGLESYSYSVDFNTNTVVTFTIPEGYDHTGLEGRLGTKILKYSTIYSDLGVEEGYEYTTDKIITFTISKISRDFELNIDLTKVQFKTFDLKLSSALSNFKCVIVDEKSVENLTEVHKDKNVLEELYFVGNKLTIEYGKYAILVYNKLSNMSDISALYSSVNKFSVNVATISGIPYVYYNCATRGNSIYYYSGNASSRMFYLGKMQSSIEFFDSIPNYQKEAGIEFDKRPNTFYLLSNKAEYNSDMLDIEIFRDSKKLYVSGDENIDKVGDVVIEKCTSDMTLLNKYDTHRLYLGEGLSGDRLLNSDEKEGMANDLYIRVGSSTGLVDQMGLYLLQDEKEPIIDIGSNATPAITQFVSNIDSSVTYAKLTKDILTKFCVNRTFVGDDENINYQIGNAILFVKQKSLLMQPQYSTINVFYNFNNQKVDNYKDYRVVPYILNDDGTKDFGFVDYHSIYDNSDYGYNRAIVKFVTTKLFDITDDGNYSNDIERKTLYFDVIGPDYIDHRTNTISKVNFKYNGVLQYANGLSVENASVLNGVLGSGVSVKTRTFSDGYLIETVIYLNSQNSASHSVDFGALDLPEDLSTRIFVTNKASFASISDFTEINAWTKERTISLGYSVNIYYFIVSPRGVDFDFDVYLDLSDDNTKLTSSKSLFDIAGNKITLSVNGIAYQIMVKSQISIFSSGISKYYVK